MGKPTSLEIEPSQGERALPQESDLAGDAVTFGGPHILGEIHKPAASWSTASTVAEAPANWPMARYDAGHTSYNAAENELAPTLVQNISQSFIPDASSLEPALVVDDYVYILGDDYTIRAYDLGDVQDNRATEVSSYRS